MSGRLNLLWKANYLAVTLLINLMAALLCICIQMYRFTEINVVVIYILSVQLTASVTRGYRYGILASVLSILSFNFIFTPPVFTFSVEDTNYIFTFIVMLVGGLLTSALTSKLVQTRELANQKEKQKQILFQVSSALSKTVRLLDVVRVSVENLSALYNCEVVSVIYMEDSAKWLTAAPEKETLVEKVDLEKAESFVNTRHSIPVKVRDKTVCVMCLPSGYKEMGQEEHYLLGSMIMQTANAIQRVFLTHERESAKAEIERERLKSNMLRAISHDLRTPLAAIGGSAEMLMEKLEQEENIRIARGIYEDVQWLTHLVENVLSLTKIQENQLLLRMQPNAVEEVISSVVEKFNKFAPDHHITLTAPDEVLFVPMDSRLIERVLINFLENAVKHTEVNGEINVAVWLKDEKVWFEVADNGPGIQEKDLPRLFDTFFVAEHAGMDGKRGIGLGLAICKAIVQMHGGDIYAENSPAGGAVFRFYLNR